MGKIKSFFVDRKLDMYNILYSDSEYDEQHCRVCGREIYKGRSKICGICVANLDNNFNKGINIGGKVLTGAVLIIYCIRHPDQIKTILKKGKDFLV